jgi:mRNA interferase RelE/StbE
VSGDRPYEVALTATPARELDRFSEKVAAACVAFIFGPLAENPPTLGKALRNEFEGLYSARRGDYRVIYAIDDARRRIAVIHVDRRSDIYR